MPITVGKKSHGHLISPAPSPEDLKESGASPDAGSRGLRGHPVVDFGGVAQVNRGASILDLFLQNKSSASDASPEQASARDKAKAKISKPEISTQVDDILNNLPGSDAAKEKLMDHIFSHALEQEVENPEQFASHGFDHSIRVKQHIDSVVDDNPQLLDVMENKYALNEEQARAVLGLVAVYHDFGYPTVGARGKSLHAVTGAAITMDHEFRETFSEALGMSQDESAELCHDFTRAVLFHGADKVEHAFDAKIKVGHAEFLVDADNAAEAFTLFNRENMDEEVMIVCSEQVEQNIRGAMAEGSGLEGIVFERPGEGEVSPDGKFLGRAVDLKKKKDKVLGLEYHQVDAQEDPLAFCIRVADNMDMTHERLSEFQQDESYRMIYHTYGNTKGNVRGNALAALEDVEKYVDSCGGDMILKYSPERLEEAQAKLSECLDVYGPVIGHYVGEDALAQAEPGDIEDLLTAYKSGIIEEIFEVNDVSQQERGKLRDVGLKMHSQDIMHNGGLEVINDVHLQIDHTGRTCINVEVERDEFLALNENTVTERSLDNIGNEQSMEVGVGEYQIWRGYEALRSLRFEEQTIPIRVFDQDGEELTDKLVFPRAYEQEDIA